MAEPERKPFPEDTADFDADDRIAFSKQADTYILEDEQGNEWEWLAPLGRWIQSTDEADIQRQAEAYKFAGVDEDEPALNPAQKRKDALEDPEFASKTAKTAHHATASAAVKPARANTAIFVTGLPRDVDLKEVTDLFGRCGIIAESVETADKRVKLYKDEDGNLNGEALIIFFLPQSVWQAVELYDQSWFPRADPDDKMTFITVAPADKDFKHTQDDAGAQDLAHVKATKVKGKYKPSTQQVKAKAEAMNKRLTDWDDDDPSTMPQTSSRFDKVVVVKNFFTDEDIEEATFEEDIEDIKDDIRPEAEKHGEVKNITVYDQEQEGVVTIRFGNAQAAKACAEDFDGRSFGGEYLTASIATGSEHFKKTRKMKSSSDDEGKRLDDFNKYIEGKKKNGSTDAGEKVDGSADEDGKTGEADAGGKGENDDAANGMVDVEDGGADGSAQS